MSIQINCRTITPLWTGGADRRIDRVYETGILGSLRWWFELFARGVGADVCDPTSHTCLYDPDQPQNGLCLACQVFGATGWRRRFRLAVRDNKLEPVHIEKIPLPAHKHGANNAVPTWYFPQKPRRGPFSIILSDLDPRAAPHNFDPQVIAGLVQFLADWAAIGARSQMGLGQFEVDNRQAKSALRDYLLAHRGAATFPTLPSLDNLFLAVMQAPTSDPKETFELKYDLRQLFRTTPMDRDVRHKVMGTTAQTMIGGANYDGIGAKVKMSWPDRDGLMRVWGWLPTDSNFYTGGWSRDRVANAIHGRLSTLGALHKWLEVGASPRNLPAPGPATAVDLLNLLLT